MITNNGESGRLCAEERANAAASQHTRLVTINPILFFGSKYCNFS